MAKGIKLSLKENVAFGKQVMREEFVANMSVSGDGKELRISDGEGLDITLDKKNLGRFIEQLVDLREIMEE